MSPPKQEKCPRCSHNLYLGKTKSVIAVVCFECAEKVCTHCATVGTQIYCSEKHQAVWEIVCTGCGNSVRKTWCVQCGEASSAPRECHHEGCPDPSRSFCSISCLEIYEVVEACKRAT